MVEKHHAVVFEGDRTAGLARVRMYAEETLGVTLVANPDVTVSECEQYTIDEARELKRRAYQTPLGSAQVFVLAFERVTHQAQNALLKLFEEPATDTHFLLVVPSVEILLPTVRSRLAYGGRVVGGLSEQAFAKAFIHASFAERISMIEPLYKNVKDAEKQVARTRARAMVDALEAHLHSAGVRKNATALKEIAFVRQYLGDTSSSLKMLLEHLAVTLYTQH